MAVPPEFIEDLRQRVPLSDVVGRRVKLIRKGRRHSGLCPFHAEKTPSFSVVDDDGFYHCFGCGVHGDAISFLREMEGLEFMEAVERLAEMAGLACRVPCRKIRPHHVSARPRLIFWKKQLCFSKPHCGVMMAAMQPAI